MSTSPPAASVPDPPALGLPIRLRTAWFARLAAAALIIATPLATWWVIGPNPGNEYRNNPTASLDTWDYMFHPPVIDPSLERTLGIASLVVASLALVSLVAAAGRGRIDRRWWPPILALCAVGVVLGIAERVMTSAVIGANIGGGMMLLFGTPFLIVLIGGSALWSRHVVRTTRLVGRE